MNNSISKALLSVIALSTSIMAVKLIPISRKAYLFNLCRNDMLGGMSLIFLPKTIKVEIKRNEERYSKAIDKSNYYLQKIYKKVRNYFSSSWPRSSICLL